MGTTNSLPLLEARIYAYELLKRSFVEEPNRMFIDSLINYEIVNSFPFTKENHLIKEGVTQAQNYLVHEHGSDEESYENLHWDYTSLFIGPHKLPAPPWESAYLNEERLLFQEETLKVRRAYIEYNLLPKFYGLEADDHIGLELDFMYQLSLLAMKNYVDRDFDKFNKVIEDQMNFLNEHLLKWVSAFCKDVNQNAQTNFYKGMSKILQGFLELDELALKDLQKSIVEVC